MYISIYLSFLLGNILDMSLINKIKYEQDASNGEHHENESEEENSSDEQEEEINIFEQVQGLFSSDIFPNAIEMYRAYRSQFDIVEFLKTHQIVSQYDYIRLINYIRSEVDFYFKNFLMTCSHLEPFNR